MCARGFIAEQAANEKSQSYEDREAKNLQCESEAFLARKMKVMQMLQAELQVHR